MGTRTKGAVIYPESELAQRHDAGVAQETSEPDEAYASYPKDEPAAYRDGWLPGA
jgi:hypothetical protein